MFKFQADLTNLLNRYIGKQHQFGQNDCNILVADYLDTFCSTNYLSKLKGQYSSIKQGINCCKELTGFNNVLEACQKHLTISDKIENGSVLLIKKELNQRVYYIATVVFNNKALVEHENRYTLVDVQPEQYTLIFNRS
ncbi:DUF6950 family protein [Klebsiella quasipneumoniae]|uniref:DUF6950 family protein n=1 Tax=Klebsiella quasipneumoniae TaxID=1463165 RepID=UPI0027DFC3DF|nr:hypothetical protein [Klebsiella quasipneumoniae]MDQ6443018.1 hypothetical protein [Klebsiella quasipneumoniae]